MGIQKYISKPSVLNGNFQRLKFCSLVGCVSSAIYLSKLKPLTTLFSLSPVANLQQVLGSLDWSATASQEHLLLSFASSPADTWEIQH